MENNKLTFEIKTKEEEEREKEELKKKKEAFQEKKNKYSLFFNNPTGIEFLRDVAITSGIFKKRALFYNSQGLVDMNKICFSDGYREMFLEILDLLNEDIINKVLEKNGK